MGCRGTSKEEVIDGGGDARGLTVQHVKILCRIGARLADYRRRGRLPLLLRLAEGGGACNFHWLRWRLLAVGLEILLRLV